MGRYQNHVECRKRPVTPAHHEIWATGEVRACPWRRGPALASMIWTPGTLISGCPLQGEEWDNLRQASTALFRKSAPCPFVSTSC